MVFYLHIRYETKVRTHFSIACRERARNERDRGRAQWYEPGNRSATTDGLLCSLLPCGVAGWGLWVCCVAQYRVPMTAVVLMTAQNTRSPRRVTMEASQRT